MAEKRMPIYGIIGTLETIWPITLLIFFNEIKLIRLELSNYIFSATVS